MSWLNNLYLTYEDCNKTSEFTKGEYRLLPLDHTYKQAHIEVCIDDKGNFLKCRSKIIPKLLTIIPVTEASLNRTSSKIAPHPLCDKIHYCALDYKKFHGKKRDGSQQYLSQLKNWVESEYSHPKIRAVYKYICKNSLINDLVSENILYVNSSGNLIDKPNHKDLKLELFQYVKDQSDSVVRWIVETPGDPETNCWTDDSLILSWINYSKKLKTKKNICLVSGQIDSYITEMHPSGIRNISDRAKIISSNDTDNFTFRGKFIDPLEVTSISSEVSQKAHNALRWLIQRNQCFTSNEQVFVIWEKSGNSLPNLFASSFDLLSELYNENVHTLLENDFGQAFAQLFKKYLAGYSVKLTSNKNITILGLDSASTGRLSITYYKELSGSDFLHKIEKWHTNLAWEQRIAYPLEKKKSFKIIYLTGAPALKEIAVAAYGKRIDDKLLKKTNERLLSCVIDDLQIPFDLMNQIYHRTCNRQGMEEWEWDKTLRIFCSVYKSFNLHLSSINQRRFSMALDKECSTRDYLFGRLLAVADCLEQAALRKESNKKEITRPTNAARYMQRFSTHPMSTWQTIYLALNPYMSKIGGLSNWYDQIITEISSKFDKEEYSDSPLKGEFLLAYFCQKKDLFTKRDENESNESQETEE